MGDLTAYIREAMRRASYSMIEDADTWFLGEIPDLAGVFAVSGSLEGGREELRFKRNSKELSSQSNTFPSPLS